MLLGLGFRVPRASGVNVGTLIVRKVLGVPKYKYSVIYPQALF